MGQGARISRLEVRRLPHFMTDQTPKCQTDGHQVNNKGGKPYLQHSASTTPGGRSYRTFSKEPYQRYNPKARPQNQGFTKVERPFQPGPPRGGTPTKTTVLIPLDTHFNGSSVHFFNLLLSFTLPQPQAYYIRRPLTQRAHRQQVTLVTKPPILTSERRDHICSLKQFISLRQHRFTTLGAYCDCLGVLRHLLHRAYFSIFTPLPHHAQSV